MSRCRALRRPLAVLACAALAAPAAASAAPANDGFAAAAVLGAPLSASSAAATGEPGERNHAGTTWNTDADRPPVCTSSTSPSAACNPSVWYRWTAPADGWTTVTTCGAATRFDTTLAVYRGATLGSLAKVVDDDDMGVALCPGGRPAGRESAASFLAVAGTEYRVAVSGFFGESGGFALSAGPDVQPPDTYIDRAPPDGPAFEFSGFEHASSKSVLSFECSLDGAAFSSCTSPVTYEGLAPGGHELQVRARDAAGNADPTPASHSWALDAAGNVIVTPGEAGGPGSGGGAPDAIRALACANVRVGTARRDVLLGTDRGDLISGLAGNDTIRGGAGDDCLRGRGGADRIYGGSGRDRLEGGPGRDRLSDGSGNDVVYGGSGNDTIRVGAGRNRISGGSGHDVIDATNARRDVVSCGPGRDRVRADRVDRLSRCERVRRVGRRR